MHSGALWPSPGSRRVSTRIALPRVASARAALVAAFILIGGCCMSCAPVSRCTAPRLVAAFPVGDDLDPASLRAALQSGLAAAQRQRLDPKTVRTLVEMTEVLDRGGYVEARDHLGEHFEVFEYAPSMVRVTAYFEAHLRGARIATDRYRYPVYSPPDELAERSSFSREQIDFEHTLASKGLELAWVDDPIALFFLHVQGSGVIEFEDGSVMRVQYAGNNGREYRAIGALMTAEQLITPPISMQAIDGYLRAHPEAQRRILSYNPRYIFFRPAEQGPIGSTGAVLTPFRSVAVDPACFPLGALGILLSSEPLFDSRGNPVGERQFSRFIIAQDTGAAIKGSGRVDLFVGGGLDAARVAGHMNQSGRLFLLVKRGE